MPAVSAKRYYKAFASIFGGFATAFGLLPLISQAVPDQWWFASYLFPPLNDAYRLPAILVTALVTAVVYGFRDSPLVQSRKKRMKLTWTVFALVLVGLSAFLISTELFVKTIDRPSVGETVTLTVGYERTLFATQTFGNANDEEMLRQRGTTDEEVYRLWTAQSVVTARLALLLSYVLFLGSSVGVLSLQVLYDVLGTAAGP